MSWFEKVSGVWKEGIGVFPKVKPVLVYPPINSDFTGTIGTPPDSNIFTSSVAGSGNVSLDGTGNMKIYAGTVDSDAAILSVKEAITQNRAQSIKVKAKANAIPSGNYVYMIKLSEESGTPSVGTQTAVDAKNRGGIIQFDSGRVSAYYQTTSSSYMFWNGTSWQSTYIDLPTGSSDTYYVFLFESDGSNFRFIVKSSDESTTYLTTSWTAWSGFKALTNPLYSYVGEPFTTAFYATVYVDYLNLTGFGTATPTGAYTYGTMVDHFVRVAGVWRDGFAGMYLYFYGDQKTSITGGWIPGYSAFTGSQSIESDKLLISVTNTGSDVSIRTYTTTNAINLTNYTSLHCVYTRPLDVTVDISAGTSQSSRVVFDEYIAQDADDGRFGTYELIANITAANGNYYVKVDAVADVSAPLTARIIEVHKVWVE